MTEHYSDDDMSIYFDDILRNKEMIKEMFKTNILVYEDKIKKNEEMKKELRDELNRITSDFHLIENRLKLEYGKAIEQYQKHDINYKLLEKTSAHYKSLIREREEEIKKIDEQSIFAYQDYQNKKIKLDCICVQTIEAEFQLKNLQKRLEEKMNKLIELNNCNSTVNNGEVVYSNPNININNEYIKPPSKDVDKFLKENLPYRSSYVSNKSKSVVIDNSDTRSMRSEKSELPREFFDTITMNSDNIRRNNCIIY